MSKVIGIDLGTGFSCVSTIDNGEPIIIPNSEGKRTTPSIVCFTDEGRKVGDPAKRQRITNPKNTVSLIKRFMGVNYNQCKDIINNVTYTVVDRNGVPRVVINDKEYFPEEISSFIVAKMKKTAEDFFGEEVTDAVITCPAWFDNEARKATKLAGTTVGLNVLRVLNEPTAAIIASDIKTDGEDVKRVMVADIGCGTTDFCVIEISNGLYETLSTKGDVFLGGSDFDNAIAKWIIDTFKEQTGIDVSKDAQAYTRVLEAAENAKIELSTSTSTDITLSFLAYDEVKKKPLNFDEKLTRSKMEQLTSDLVDRIIGWAKLSLKESGLEAKDLECILLVGGQSRSLAIQEALKKEFGRPLNKSVNPDEAVAKGAAILCNTLAGDADGNEVVLLDVTPITLGIETVNGAFTPIIKSNTTYPTKATQTFSTAMDNQTEVVINVLQGERPQAVNNKQIGIFRLDGIAPAPKGMPKIDVTFDINSDGILNVSAVDKATGKEQHITIENSTNLSKDEIERIKKEAEEFAEADKKAKEEMDKINGAEGLVFQIEKAVEEFADKLSDEEKELVKSKTEALKKGVEEKNIETIDNATKELNVVWGPIISRIYQQSATADKTDAGQSDDGVKDV